MAQKIKKIKKLKRAKEAEIVDELEDLFSDEEEEQEVQSAQSSGPTTASTSSTKKTKKLKRLRSKSLGDQDQDEDEGRKLRLVRKAEPLNFEPKKKNGNMAIALKVASKPENAVQKALEVRIETKEDLESLMGQIIIDNFQSRIKPPYSDWDAPKWRIFMDGRGAVPFRMLDTDSMILLVYAHYYLKENEEVARAKENVVFADEFGETDKSEVRLAKPRGWGIDEYINEEDEVIKVVPPVPPQKVQLTGPEEPDAFGPDGVVGEGAVDHGTLEDDPAIEAQLKTPEMENKANQIQSQEKGVRSIKEIKEQLRAELREKAGTEVTTPEELRKHVDNIEAIKASAGTPMEQKWAIAFSIATNKNVTREDFEKIEDFQLKEMILWCKRNLNQQTGRVEIPYPTDLIEIYWPVPQVYDMSDEAVTRREAILTRITNFLKKQGLEFDPINDRINATENSYRITMASMQLEHLTEKYASLYRTNEYLEKGPQMDEEMSLQIRDATINYAKSHEPVTNDNAGPLDTLEPDYLKYRELLKKYNLENGILLHEANLQG